MGRGAGRVARRAATPPGPVSAVGMEPGPGGAPPSRPRLNSDPRPASPARATGCGKRTRSTFHSQVNPGLSRSLQQMGLWSFSSISGKPSLSCFSSISLMRQRPSSIAWLMLVAVRSLATRPACADRMIVTTAPKSATAIRTSSSEKPRRRRMAQYAVSWRSES